MNKYDQLVEDLCSNNLTIRQLELAYRESIRRNKKIPEGARNLIVSFEGVGLIQFAQDMGEIVGSMELAYRRGMQEGQELAKKGE